MFLEFLEGFFGGAVEEVTATPQVEHKPQHITTAQRPTRKHMKKILPDIIKRCPTQYRFSIEVGGKTYHATYAYDRGAIYTLTYEFVGKDGTIPKLVTMSNGKPSPRDLKEYIRDRVAERKQRAQRAQTVAELRDE
jgi:hypothetical protein